MGSYIVLTLIVIIVATLFGYSFYLSKNYHFRCPKCYRDFNLKQNKIFVTVHYNDEFNLKCPFCGKKNFIKLIKNENL